MILQYLLNFTVIKRSSRDALPQRLDFLLPAAFTMVGMVISTACQHHGWLAPYDDLLLISLFIKSYSSRGALTSYKAEPQIVG